MSIKNKQINIIDNLHSFVTQMLKENFVLRLTAESGVGQEGFFGLDNIRVMWTTCETGSQSHADYM